MQRNLMCAFAVGLIAPCLVPCVASAAVVNLEAVADAFVTNGPTNNLRDNNYGGAGALMAAGAGGGKGEFKTLVRFDASSLASQFDATLGAGQWQITGATLRNAGNFGTAGSQPNNPIFPVIAAGNVNITWVANDGWVEGTGNPGSPGTTGVTFNTFNTFLTAGVDRPLGTFTWDAPGNNVQRTWSLANEESLIDDLSAGGLTSFAYAAADPAGSRGFLFNARSFGTAGNRPLLSVTAEVVPEPATLGLVSAIVATLAARRRK